MTQTKIQQGLWSGKAELSPEAHIVQISVWELQVLGPTFASADPTPRVAASLSSKHRALGLAWPVSRCRVFILWFPATALVFSSLL